MLKKLLGLLLIVMLVVFSFGVVSCDQDNMSSASNTNDALYMATQQTSSNTQDTELDAPPTGLTAKALDTLTITSSSYYYLDQNWTGDSALSKSLTINCGDGNTVYLDLQGYSISVVDGLSVITVSSGTLVLFDSVGGGTVTGASQSNNLGGGGVYIAVGAILDLYDGVAITSNATATSTYLGGGVYNAGTFNMHGGVISDNYSEGIGGGVYNKGTFNMSGGTISGNEAGSAKYGAGVYNAGTFDMSGGSITGNMSSAGGGGVSNVGDMIMSGGSISGNTASGSGAGIFSAANSTLTITGGTLSGNTTSANGGAIAVMGDSVEATISGCVIVGNTASGNGGGVVISGTNAVVDMSDCDITGNTANGNGGGVYFGSEQLNISGEVDVTNNITATGVNNIYVAEGQEIVVTDDVTGTVGVTYATSSGTIVVAEGCTINETTATSFVSDNSEYYCVWSTEQNQIVIEGEAVIDVVEDAIVTEGVASYTYGESIDVSELFDSNSNSVTYTVTAVSGSATLVGTTLSVDAVGTFVVTASTEATLTNAAAKGQVTVTVTPLEVYITDITAISRGVNENNFYVDLDESSGVIKDADGNVVAGLTIDFSSAYGAIDNELYYEDETLNGSDADNDFAVTVYNVKLGGTASANYVLSDTAITTTVTIYTGYPLVSWPTVSDVTYGDTIDNDSLEGGKVVIKVGEIYYTVSGTFQWVSMPTAEDVGSYSHAVQFVVDTDDANYDTFSEYVEDIQLLTHYVSYSINATAVTFDITNYVIDVGSNTQPTITAKTADGDVVSSDEYTILYFLVDGGVVYYAFDGSDEGDGSVDNPYKIDTTTAGSYLIGAELSDNYHHSGTVENTAKQIGVLYIGDATSYTVTFNNSSDEIISSLEGYVGDIIVMPSYTGGIGWVNDKGVFYEFGARYAQPAYDETFTLVSASEDVTISGIVTGTDLDGNSGALAGIVVQLMQGSTIVDTATTDSDGEYSFTVPAGSYNIVVTRSMTGLTNIVTVMVAAETDTTVDTIDLPSIRSNVVLDVDAGFTDITVDNLEDLIVEDEYNTITIYVDKAETNGTEQTAILELAQQDGLTTSNVKLYFDINFTEQPYATEIALIKLDSDITFYIPLAGLYQHKDSYVLYVYDDYGNVYELTEGVHFTCDGTTLTITTKIAGVYALAFTDEIETFTGDNDTVIYSSATIDLSTLFGDTDYDITGATYTLDSSSTGVGSISGNLLTVESIGDFVIIITTLETASDYSAIGTATLSVTPATITISGVIGVDRGLEEGNIAVDLDTTGAYASGVINGDSVTINFNNAYGVIVEDKDGNLYYYTYDEDADEWVDQTENFDVLIVGATLAGSDSGNYIIAYSYTTVDITTSIPHVSWPTATDILYGQDLSSSTLYGGVVVVYDGGDYIEFSTDDCVFEWSSTTEYTDDFGNILNINQLSAGTYTQLVTVSIKSTATGYSDEYNEILASYSYYVTFEIVADAVQFNITGNIVSVGEEVDLTVVANNSSGVAIDNSWYAIEYFTLVNGLEYYSLTGSVEDGDGSRDNPYYLDTTIEGIYFISAYFQLSSDVVYNYHHSGSLDSTGKQVGVLYITNSEVDTYTVTFVDSNGDSVADAFTNSYYEDILILPTLEGSTYIGWSYNGVTYLFGARFAQPEYDVVFTAVLAPETYIVSGTVVGLPLGDTEGTATAISGVGVALYQGSTLVAITTTDSDGYYSFDVAAGSYSLVVTRTQGIENIITQYLSVTGTTTIDTITIPNIRQNTIVSVDSGVENVTVDGLDDLHADDEENTYTITVNDGSANVVVLADIQSSAADDGITNEDMKVFLDISITDDSGNIVQLSSNTMLTFYISLAGMYQGYDNYYVYRYHTADDGTVTIEKVTTTANEYGEYLSISEDGSTLILNVCRFSVFGIAFTNDEPVEQYTVTYSVNGGTAVLPGQETYDDNTTVTVTSVIPTLDGYTFVGWQSNDGTMYYAGNTLVINGADVTLTAVYTANTGTTDDETCWLCGSCSAFLGICLWVWLVIIVVIVAIAITVSIYLIRKNKKKKSNK